MKRKSILVCIFILLTFVLMSCTNSKNVSIKTYEFFENKLVILKKGDVYKINYEDLVTKKFSYEIEEYNYVLGNGREEVGSDILFEDDGRYEPNIKLYGDSKCLELSNDVITAKGLGRVTVNILIKMKRYSSSSWRELLCCPILEVVVTDDSYSNFKRINKEEDFNQLNNSSDLFLINHSLDLKGSTEGINFSGVLINPYNYFINLTLDEDHKRLFYKLEYACINNLRIENVKIEMVKQSQRVEVISFYLTNSILDQLFISKIDNANNSYIINLFWYCKNSSLSNIEIHTDEGMETDTLYISEYITSDVFFKKILFIITSPNIRKTGVTMDAQCTVSNSGYAERKKEDAFEVYDILFINTTSNKDIECGFQYFAEKNNKYPFGKDKVFYSVGFKIIDDLFMNKTMEEVTSGESLFTSGAFKFEKGKLPTLFY